MTIPYCDITNGSRIYAHAPTTIFIRNQNNRTKDLTYIPMVQKILDSMLNLLSLLGVGSIGSSVWQAHSRNQVNLILNPVWVEILEVSQWAIHHYIPTKG
jgi:hypothetical protein